MKSYEVSTNHTDTLQWCELHRGHCKDVVPVRRHFEDPNRQDEIFYACQGCVRDLKKAGLTRNSKFAKLPCVEVTVPVTFSQFPARSHLEGRIDCSLLGSRQQGKPTISSLRSGQIAYEVTLDALQVKYLRALGLRVIPA
jgi:hypothetical protein